MTEFLNTPYFGFALTLVVFLACRWLADRVKSPFLNPLLWSIIVIVAFLLLTDIPLETYNLGGRFVNVWVAPATVALAIKLYHNLAYLKQYYRVILLGIFFGVLVHTLIIIGLGLSLQLESDILLTLYPKSVTTAIAIEISESVGGIPALTVVAVVVTGIIGAIAAEPVMKLMKVEHEVAVGTSIGASAHALGTTKAIELGSVQGAMSSLAIVVTGVIVTLLATFAEKIIHSLC